MTELQLEFIRKFGRKELTEGCMVYIGKQIILRGLHFNPRYINFHQGTYYIDDKKYIAEVIISVIRFSEVPAKEMEILGHPVHWEDVFARLKEALGADDILQLQFGRMQIFSRKLGTIEIECNAIISPMEQPELIEQLLLLSN